MKKLAVVLAALLLACVFVGCDVLGEKTLLGTWEYNYGSGKEYWEFKEDGIFVWKEGTPNAVNDVTGKWVYNNPEITITDFRKSYDGVWSIDFVSATEMKWTIVKFEDPDYKNPSGTVDNKKRLEEGVNFTLTKVTADAE